MGTKIEDSIRSLNCSYVQKPTLQDLHNQYTQLSRPMRTSTGIFFHQLSTVLSLKNQINTANQDVIVFKDEAKAKKLGHGKAK